MSITKLAKVTIYGHVSKKDKTLTDLQNIGCLHILPLKEGEYYSKGVSAQSREALKFLLSCPSRRRQVRRYWKFDARKIEMASLELQERMRTLEDEKDYLIERIENLKLWGDFEFPTQAELKEHRLWFYLIPHYEMKKFERPDLIWKIINRDNRFCYTVIVSENEPENMPVERLHMGGRSRRVLEERLEEVEIHLEDIRSERFSLTRWCYLLARSLNQLDSEAELEKVKFQTFDNEPLFALQAWAPKEKEETLKKYARASALALELKEPERGENPPTLLHNQKAASSGEDLVKFYMTPGYWLWDPSSVVFYSFCLFFAMILSDAGYGIVLGLIILLFWKKMRKSETGKRLRTLFSGLVISTIIWGMLVGSYFGITPPKGSILGSIHFLSVHDFATMMGLSVVIGIVHVVIANLMNAKRSGWHLEALAPLGWAFMVLGGFLFAVSRFEIPIAYFLDIAGKSLAGGGAACVIFFTSSERNIFKRILFGFLGLTKVTQAFGDVLSYLRLFALGLASASLAISFNGLGTDVMHAVPGIGIFFAILIFLIGHVLNFLLSMLSGFVHGLRLNFIEFFNWGIAEEGRPFKAFKRKEEVSWNY